jgi:hypothetical protein
VLRITVVDPAGSPGASVFARPAVGYFIDGVPDGAAQGALREIADTDGSEPFRVYARYYLGAHCLDEQTNRSEGDPARCLADLTRAANVDFQLRDLALLKAARAASLSGRNDEALDHARRAVQTSVRPTTRARAEALLVELAAAPVTAPGRSSGSRPRPEPEDERQLAALIEEYLAALERGDLRACRSMLSRDFLYAGTFDRDSYVAMLERDRTESPLWTGIDLRTSESTYSLEGSIAVVEFGLYAIAPGMPTSPVSRVRVQFEQSARRWRIVRWDRLAAG